MVLSDGQTYISRLPRNPFLSHSDTLLRHLLSFRRSQSAPRILEIGCGPRSPLVPMLNRQLGGNFALMQVDARPEILRQAAAYCPSAKVMRGFAHELPDVPDGSVDLIIGMSVFDQNPFGMMPAIARELYRVSAPEGMVVYIHNEELNAPATFASMLRESPPIYLLPCPAWQFENDLEFCRAKKDDIEQVLARTANEFAGLRRYLDTLRPPKQSGGARQVSLELDSVITPESFQSMRAEVARLHEEHGVGLSFCSTADLLRNQLEGRLFNSHHGFRVADAGVFELQAMLPWRSIFREKPAEKFFARGITRFGMASNCRPSPITAYRQDLNGQPIIQDSDETVLLVAYQYGLVGFKN